MSMGLSRRSALAQLAAGSLSACAAPGDRALRFWAMGREGEVVQSLMPAYVRAHPDPPVTVQQLPWTAAHAKLLTAFAGGDLPDLCQIGNTWIAEFFALGALRRLDGVVATSPVVRPADGFEGIWRTNTIAGGLYGIPWYVDTRLLFYRRDLLDKAGHASAPTTWGDWMEAMAAIKALVGAGAYAALLPLNEPEPLLSLALQQGEPLLRDGGSRGNFQSPGFKRALTFYAEIFARGLAPPASDTELGNLYDEFARGYFSFYVSGPWNLGEFRRRLPPDRQDIWMTAPMPGPDGPGVSLAGGSSLVVFAGSRRAGPAWRLIEYLSTLQTQSRFYALTGDLPARRDAWAGAALAYDPKAAAFRDQLTRVRLTPQVPEWEAIATQVQLVAEQMIRGGLTVGAATAEMDRLADALLAKRRWMIAHGRSAA
ncbi:MAG TPA: extracellular solute-binding protein [Caulobacteraceae bacterium]|jgi:multiple sugar transport system substrate-binding protein